MSWIQKLYETYERCQSMIGADMDEKAVPLLPICHTTQQAHIEIVIDQEGNFLRAKVVPKETARTIVPCTEASGGRSGTKPENHPLCDKLQYVAGDFTDFGGEVTKGFAKDPKEPFQKYKELLSDWCASSFSHPKIKAVLKYIEKERVIKDLVAQQILHLGNDGKLIDKWDKKSGEEVPELFKVLGNNAKQGDAFVRWAVEIPGDPQAAVWTDMELFTSWIKYYSSTKQKKAFCYVTGDELLIADQHPAKIRNDGDKAKLISANDDSGFTFRGRFREADQACSVGFTVTQKAHNALRWLIGKQGYRKGSQAIVAWAVTGEEIPAPLDDTFSMLGIDSMVSDIGSSVSTAQEFALKLNKKIAGYSAKLGDTTGIVVMGLDSINPGRLSITFYRELTGSEFLERIERWHSTCSWIHDYRLIEIDGTISKKKKERKRIRFIGAPSPSDIAEAAYGNKVDDNLRNATVERILPCIIDGRKLPRDLVESAVRRACNRMGKEDWEWNKTLSIACALYKKYHEEEEYEMALDENRKTRDYLYGRLLAIADNLEEWALKSAGENRQTNAARLMQRFAEHPYSTWRTIELALAPYKARMGNKAAKHLRLITEVMNMFSPDDFINDKKLSGEFLLGYHCQREALWHKESDDKESESEKVS